MAIEQTGTIEPITPRIFDFLEQKLAGISLDQDGDRFRRPDYTCLRGLLIVEVKSLETDPAHRIDNLLAPEKKKESWPNFYGEWPIESILKHLPDRRNIEQNLIGRIGRAIQSHIEKSESQFREYSQRNIRKNRVNLLIIVNEYFIQYDPSNVTKIIQKEIVRMSERGGIKYNYIDAVVYISESHVVNLGGQISFPIPMIGNVDMESNYWKWDVVSLLTERWSEWNDSPLHEGNFSNLEHIEALSHGAIQNFRQDNWRQGYKRLPYLQHIRDEDLQIVWDAITISSNLVVHKKSPISLAQIEINELAERFAHLQEEVARRGLPLDYFKPEPQRGHKVIESLPYEKGVKDWLHKHYKT